MKDLNPVPRLRNPNRVTARMLAHATVGAGIHVNIKVKIKSGKWLTGWDTCHDVTTNVNRALAYAKAAKMPVMLEGPDLRNHDGQRWAQKKVWVWTCSVPPARGRFYRVFRARTPAKAICAAILDWIDHPQETT